jgi:dual specificity tyrosine-phosphorylation-regulated kinase 2/3/4
MGPTKPISRSTRAKHTSQFVFSVQNSAATSSVSFTLASPKSSHRSLVPEIDAGSVSFPISPTTALQLFADKLSTYEASEIQDYKLVYFLGPDCKKTKPSSSLPNFGFDDDRNDYNIVIGDHMAYRYEALSLLGKGSFGQVLKCLDHKTHQMVALKVIRNKKLFHKQGAVEVKILSHLKSKDQDDNKHIVRILDFFLFRSHICITFEMLSLNLYEFIKANEFKGLSDGLVRRFAVQLLTALEYMSQQHIVHCDLKPENILLVNENRSTLKVIDLGSSCFEHERLYTYIQSRFYRAPEIILGIEYTSAIDMWSFGCIAAELFTGYPLFPGHSEHEQLLRIMQVLGPPPTAVLQQATRKHLFFEADGAAKVVPDHTGKRRYPGQRNLPMMLPSADPLFIDFVGRCFEYDPTTRMTPTQALNHDWVKAGLARRPLQLSASKRTRTTQ